MDYEANCTGYRSKSDNCTINAWCSCGELASLLLLFTLFVIYFILSRLLYLAYSANLGLLCMPHPGMGPLV